MTTIRCDGPRCQTEIEGIGGVELDPYWWCLNKGRHSYPYIFCSKTCLAAFVKGLS